jgi:hypothetical protein
MRLMRLKLNSLNMRTMLRQHLKHAALNSRPSSLDNVKTLSKDFLMLRMPPRPTLFSKEMPSSLMLPINVLPSKRLLDSLRSNTTVMKHTQTNVHFSTRSTKPRKLSPLPSRMPELNSTLFSPPPETPLRPVFQLLASNSRLISSAREPTWTSKSLH